MTTRAIAYLRTSSAANVEGDSAKRQDAAIGRYAKQAGYQVTVCFWDAAVSGVDPIETRAGFDALLTFAEREDVKVVLVEDASRFARAILAQELGVLALLQRGIRLFTTSGQELTDESDPSKVMYRQIAGAFAQYEKTRLVSKLRGARDRASVVAGKRIEGRKGYRVGNPAMVKEAKRLARKSPKSGKARSLRQIAEALAAGGYSTGTGKPFAASQVQRIIAA